MMWITIISSLVVLIALAVVLFTYKTTNPSKIVIGILLVILFLIIAISVFVYRKQITIAAIFLAEGTKFTGNKPSTIIYIFLFLGLTLGFFLMLIKEYQGLISVGTPTFHQTELYYSVNKKGLWLTWVVLGIQLIWGLSFLK
jgi:hypothetical protein